MAPSPYVVNSLAPPPSTPPTSVHTDINPTVIFARIPPPPPVFLSANDTEPVVRAHQNKLGVCGNDRCFGLISLAIGVAVFFVLILLAWGLYKWRKARTHRNAANDIERRGGAISGRSDRDEFELAHPPSPESVKKRRMEEKLRRESERDAKMGVGYQGRSSQHSAQSSILKAVQNAGDRSVQSAPKVDDDKSDRRKSSFSQADTEFEEIDLNDVQPGPSQRSSAGGLAPPDLNHNNSRVSAITTMGEIEAGTHVATKKASNSTVANSITSLDNFNNNASSLSSRPDQSERYPEPGSYGNFSGSRGSNSTPNPPYPDEGPKYGFASGALEPGMGRGKKAIRDVCSVEELGGEHVRTEDLGKEF
ncbi:MAG: hypothetical protein Q9160_000406 [Pyrenula sp. 1 TL-2023]